MRALGAALVTALLLVCADGWAQTQTFLKDSFVPVQLFNPAPGPLNFLSVESPEIGDDMKPSVGVMFIYEHRPFVLIECDAADNCGDDLQVSQTKTINIVENLATIDVLAGFSFLERFQAGIGVPVVLWQRGDNAYIQTMPNGDEQLLIDAADPGYKVTAVGDVRVHLKARIIGNELQDGPVLSAAVIPTLPLKKWFKFGEGYTGEKNVTVTAPKILFGYRFGPLRSSVNVGLLLRGKSKILSSEVGHAISYGAAVGYAFIPQIELMGEIYGSKSLVSENFTDIEGAPLLFLGGVRFNIGDFHITLGGGGGIISGIGVPQFQVAGGAGWAPKSEKKPEEFTFEKWDVDGDGINNEVDQCPEKPEDKDDFQDEDGCPDFDNDGDGILDGYDSCPMSAEDKDQFRDDDGCPDLDHDEDGVKEPDDKCPEKAEDFDEFEDEDGCPEEDNDKDGVPDAEDFCPNKPEDVDGFEDDDACPDPDNDNDGVADAQDKCPNEPETFNNRQDDDGCPDKGKQLVVVTDEKIELKQRIEFKTGSDIIRGEESFEILNIVSNILKGSTEIRVIIEGHTDNRGNAKRNRDLSARRAESVKQYLVTQGIAADRLDTMGYGPDKPIESNKRRSGRKANRRVEFIIIKPQRQVVEEGAAVEGETPTDDEGAMDFTVESEEEAEEQMDFTIEPE